MRRLSVADIRSDLFAFDGPKPDTIVGPLPQLQALAKIFGGAVRVVAAPEHEHEHEHDAAGRWLRFATGVGR